MFWNNHMITILYGHGSFFIRVYVQIMSSNRPVPRPSSNLWRLVAEGEITEDDVTRSGRIAFSKVAQGTPLATTTNTLVRRYEDALRQMCHESTVYSLPSVRSNDMVDDRDREGRITDLERRIEQMENHIDTLYAALAIQTSQQSVPLRPATA